MSNNYFKDYYLKNKERMGETLKLWKENNKEHLREYRKEYYREYNRRKAKRKKFIDKIMAINLCIVEAHLNQEWNDVEVFRSVMVKAIDEALKDREKENNNI